MSLITPDFGLVFWMVVIFGIVFLILSKVGFPIISGMVEKRTDHINQSLKAADEARESLAGLSEQQKKMIEETRRQQADILSEAARTREEIIAGAREKAQNEADKIVLDARERMAAERENTLRDISSQVALLSVDVAEKVLRENLADTASQNALIDKLVKEVSSAEMN